MSEKSASPTLPNANVTTEELYYESNRYNEREYCRECGSRNVYTRVYFHEKTNHSRWLCYNCSDDYVQYRGYKPVVVTATISHPSQQ